MEEVFKKRELRQKARELRSRLDLPQVNKDIVGKISVWPIYQNAAHVLTYSAFGSEIDLKALNSDTKSFYLTRTNEGSNLTIHNLDSKQERHKYGYLQPVPGLEPISPSRIDLVLVPGLAFSVDGSRLGYGKGYYDRLLAKMPKTIFAGVCPSSQIMEDIPQHEFDVKMHYLITEDKIIKTTS